MTSPAPQSAPVLSADEKLAELDRLLAAEALISLYQPIVELESGDTVAYEALARGPVGSPLHMPNELFGTAARNGRLAELDWACRAAALRGALGTALGRPTALFVNIEPASSAAGIPQQYEGIVAAAGHELQVVFELTERALTERPSEVLAAVRHLRALGVSIALDDVGVDPRSLALMPYLQPEIIKLDMSVVQGQLSPSKARTMHAVNAHAERSGALILAEGIEHEQHLERALALGARYGQGWHFGRPGPAPTHREVGRVLAAVASPVTSDSGLTPYQSVRAAGGPSRVANKRLLLALSRELEVHAETLGPECVVLSNLQDVRHLTPQTRLNYAKLAERTAFAGLLGCGVGTAPAGETRGGPLEPGEPLAREWSVCVVSPHFAAAMVATDLGDDPRNDMGRRFAYCLTYDRETVVQASRIMMARIAPSDPA